MIESKFQKQLKDKILNMFEGSWIIKNDTIQGYPDLTVHFGSTYACLECKRSKDAPHQPNQDWWVNRINEAGGFACFVYPENEETVLEELSLYFGGGY